MTRLKALYVVLCIVGVVLPYSQFIPWIAENGLDVPLLIHEIADSRLAAFGWLDVMVSAITLLVLILDEGRKDRVPYLWLPIIGTLVVGVSLGLPLYLFLREMRGEAVT